MMPLRTYSALFILLFVVTCSRGVGQNELTLIFPYGTEKKAWLEKATEKFLETSPKVNGKPIRIDLLGMGSGEMMEKISSGDLKAHIVGPASGAFIEMANAKSSRRIVDEPTSLVQSPVVIAMWEESAKALGWPDRPIGWRDIMELSSDDGLAKDKLGVDFRFGHTHPEYSNSGLIALLAEVYAATDKNVKLEPLTSEDLDDPTVLDFVTKIESSVAHYGESTGSFGKQMMKFGPSYLSAAVLYENVVIESNSKADAEGRPDRKLATIYPFDGTFVSDHPLATVNGDWVTEDHKTAIKLYLDFLMSAPIQQEAMKYGFRPGLASLPIPDEPAWGDLGNQLKIAPVPSGEVMLKILEVFKKVKKPAHVFLVVDTSASMKEAAVRDGKSKLDLAKEGVLELLRVLGPKDSVSLLAFNHQDFRDEKATRRALLLDNLGMDTGLDKAVEVSEGLVPYGQTALFDALEFAHTRLSDQRSSEKITAIVVLSDGADTNSRYNSLAKLIGKIDTSNDSLYSDGNSPRPSIRIFSIGYGVDARTQEVLQRISDSTQVQSFEASADPKDNKKNIKQIFMEIAKFF